MIQCHISMNQNLTQDLFTEIVHGLNFTISLFIKESFVAIIIHYLRYLLPYGSGKPLFIP